jgi:hypothetical protein
MNLSITPSDDRHRGELPEKMKSCDDDQAEHLRCGGDWRGMSMQRNGGYYMHKVYKIYKYTVHRRDGVGVAAGVVVDVVVEGDSCMKKDQSAVVE